MLSIVYNSGIPPSAGYCPYFNSIMIILSSVVVPAAKLVFGLRLIYK